VTDFFREVQEDLQRDRFLKLWRRFRYPLLGVVVAIIAAVVVVVIIRDAGKARNEQDGTRYAEAAKLLADGKPADAAKAFEALATDASGGYAALARLREADAKAGAGDIDGAVAALDALSKDNRVDRVYRDLASLLAAERLIDRAPIEEVNSRLSLLLAPDSAWRSLAAELKGLAELKAGKIDQARATFEALAGDQSTASGVRFRAAELLSSLGGPLPKEQGEAPAAQTGEAKPAETAPAEAKPADPKPEDAAPDAKPADASPAGADSAPANSGGDQ